MSPRRRDEGGSAGLALEIGEALLGAASVDGLVACDFEGRVSFCNAAAARFLQLSADRAIGLDLGDALARGPDPALELRFRAALRDRTSVEFVGARPGGDDEWLEVQGLPIASGLVFFLRDVTDRERSERSLRRKEHGLRLMTESLRLAHRAAPAATWEWSGGAALRWLDIDAARALVGLAGDYPDDAVISQWRRFVAAEDLPHVNDVLAGLSIRDEAVFEYRVLGADGRTRWLRSWAAVVDRRNDGEPRRVSGVTLDVTQQILDEAKLRREVAERRRAEQRQTMLIHELNHRVKNMLATVQSVARQSLGRAQRDGPLADFEDRLMALAWTHDILTREHWAGASLGSILDRTMAPHAADGRVDMAGPDLRVSPNMALALAMGIHELATNAVKYGALSGETGRVKIRWRLDPETKPPRLFLDWQEADGPKVTPPARRGFGSRLLERGLAQELGGEVRMDFARSGLRCRISAPFQPEVAEPEAPVEEALAFASASPALSN